MDELIIARDAGALARLATIEVLDVGKRAIVDSGRFLFVLSGGSTPKILYQLLASEEFRHGIDWTKVIFFFGDERWVPSDSPDSNYRMSRDTLFSPLGIDPKNICLWKTAGPDSLESAVQYEQAIRSIAESVGQPRFDLILLGMGADGHTASLFPGSPALHETSSSAITTSVPATAATRLTLTLPAINSAANIFFLVSGDSKAQTLKKVLEAETDADPPMPAASIQPRDGILKWFIDKEAARLLDLRKIGKFRVKTYN